MNKLMKRVNIEINIQCVEVKIIIKIINILYILLNDRQDVILKICT